MGDWIAVVRRNKPLEYLCKPATLTLLTGVAVAIDPRLETQRWAFIVALAWQVYQLSDAPTAMGMVGIAMTVPTMTNGACSTPTSGMNVS